MAITELILELQKLKVQYGDIEVRVDKPLIAHVSWVVRKEIVGHHPLEEVNVLLLR